MDDYLKGGADLRMMSNIGGDPRALSSQGKFKSQQITGAIGSQIQMRHQVQSNLREIACTLTAQADTLKSAQAKIELIEAYVGSKKDAPEVREEVDIAKQRIFELKELLKLVDFELLSLGGGYDL